MPEDVDKMMEQEPYSPLKFPELDSIPIDIDNSRPIDKPPPIAQKDPRFLETHVITGFHRRSREASAIANKVIWEDEYGILYGARSIKGLPTEEKQDPAIEFDEYSPPYYLRVEGYKDDLGIKAIQRASKFLRSHGLATERVAEIRVLHEIMTKYGKDSFDDWKKREADIIRAQLQNTSGDGRGHLEEKLTYIENLRLYVIVRDYQVGERFRDLNALFSAKHNFGYEIVDGIVTYKGRHYTPDDFSEVIITNMDEFVAEYSERFQRDRNGHPTEEKVERYKEELKSLAESFKESVIDTGFILSHHQFKKTMISIFHWLNLRNKIRSSRAGEAINSHALFDVKKPDDIRRYFVEYLPQQMGNYLGKMHSLGIASGFATDHNWSLVGTLYDLDSFHGKPLGSVKAITIEDMARDLMETVGAVQIPLKRAEPAYTSVGKAGLQGGYFVQNYTNYDDLIREAMAQLFASYIRARKSERQTVDRTLEYYKTGNEDSRIQLANYGNFTGDQSYEKLWERVDHLLSRNED